VRKIFYVIPTYVSVDFLRSMNKPKNNLYRIAEKWPGAKLWNTQVEVYQG